MTPREFLIKGIGARVCRGLLPLWISSFVLQFAALVVQLREIRKQKLTSRLALSAAASVCVEQQVLTLRGGYLPECPGQEGESLIYLSMCHS